MTILAIAECTKLDTSVGMGAVNPINYSVQKHTALSDEHRSLKLFTAVRPATTGLCL